MTKKNKNMNTESQSNHQHGSSKHDHEEQPTPVVVHTIKIGTYLKEARDKKGISLKVISQQTKINITNLENLENNQIKDLPNLAYVRGYVKSLSKILNLDENRSLDILEATYGDNAPKVNAYVIEEKKIPSNDIPKDLIIKIVLGLAGLGVMAFIVVYQMNSQPVAQSANQQSEEVLQEAIEPQTVTAQTPLEPEITPIAENSEVVVKPVVVETRKPEINAEIVKVEKKEEKIESKEKDKDKEKKKRQFWPLTKELYDIENGDKRTSILALLPSEFKGTTISGKQNIIIVASRSDVWLTYKSDNDPIKKFVLKKSRSVLIRGDEIRIFLGNFAGATLFLNEEPLSISSSSSVKSLVFPQKNRGKYKMPLFVFNEDGKVETSDEYIAREGE